MSNYPGSTVSALSVLAVLLFILPADAAGQGSRPRVTVQGTYGSDLREGGDNQAVSVGLGFEHFELLVSAERLHQPSEVTRREDGFSVSRRGTTRFISGEVRFSPFAFERVSPYVLAGLGRGQSRLNVNEFFPDPVINDAVLAFAGGGVRVPVVGGLSVVADVRIVLQLEDSDDGSIYLFAPIRGGLAWRF